MTSSAITTGPLAGLRVVELGGPLVQYAGKLLVDLGAEVVLVEPPEGHPWRRQAPFATATERGPAAEAVSIPFLWWNGGKRSLALDLGRDEDRRRLRDLLAEADGLLDGTLPGHLDSLGLSYAELRRANPGLVIASLTPFGLSGPRRNAPATDLTLQAAGGLAYVCGHPEWPPAPGPCWQGYLLAAGNATAGLLLSLYNRLASGRGDLVEVSAQEAIAAEPLLNQVVKYSLTGEVLGRDGPRSRRGAARLYPATDGFVYIEINDIWQWEKFVEWTGNCPPINEERWRDRIYRRDHADELDAAIADFTRGRTRGEVYEAAQANHLAVGATCTPAEFVDNLQARARSFFIEVEDPVLGRHRQPGAPYRLSATPWTPGGRRGPRLPSLERASESAGPSWAADLPRWNAVRAARDLSRLRVADFSSRVAGPCVTRYLADHGAEVIKIENPHRPVGRDARGNGDARGRLDGSLMFDEVNRNKLSLAVDMGQAAGRNLARRLVAASDLVVENFSRRVMRRWGFDYASLRQVRPDLIMMSMQGLGQTGPHAEHVSVGLVLSSLSGLSWLWRGRGYPGPVGPGYAYPDYAVPLHGLVALLAALLHRARTGEGQFIDVAQLEATACLIGPAFLDHLVNGRVLPPDDWQGGEGEPEGVFPCAREGDRGDRWCAMSVREDGEWFRLCAAMGRPDWASDPRFATREARRRGRTALAEAIGQWTASQTRAQVVAALEGAGIPVASVLDSGDLYADLHLRRRGFLLPQEHQDAGLATHLAPVLRSAEAPPAVRSLRPDLSGDRDYVLGDVLGLDGGSIARLRQEGVIG